VRQLLLTADVHSSPILVTLMIVALRSSETSVLTRATRRNIPEVGIFHCDRSSYETSSFLCISETIFILSYSLFPLFILWSVCQSS
jgi:hypothetical protein